MALREIIVDWQVAGTPGGLNVLYFRDTEATLEYQREMLGELLAGVSGLFVGATRATVRTNGRVVDEVTGVATGFWSEPTVRTQLGQASVAYQVPNAAQALLRFNTDDVVNGRRVKGRINIPGCSTGIINYQGEIQPDPQGWANDAIAEFCDALTDFGIWHRPVNGAGGSFHVATSGSIWNEMAVQRRRR